MIPRGWGLLLHLSRTTLAFSAARLVFVMVAQAGTLRCLAFISGPLTRSLTEGRVTLIGAAETGAGLVVTLADIATRLLALTADLPAGIYTQTLNERGRAA